MNELAHSNFPSTRFQGSKRKLLPWLYRAFNTLEFESSLDLFGGTSSVSYLLKTIGKEVTFNDYLKSCTISARALVKNNSVKLDKNTFNTLFNGDSHPGIVSDIFSGVFFLDNENLEIDSLIQRIRKEKLVTNFKQNISMHCLFQALLMKRPFNLFHRANLNLRTRRVKRSFGNKVTWEKTIKELMDRARIEANKAIFNNGRKHSVLNLDAVDVKGGYDLVYLDPPYYPEQGRYLTVDYYLYYHFLEGLLDYDSWESRIDYSQKCLVIPKNDSSFRKSKFLKDLEIVLSTHGESTIVFSYKSPGLPTLKEIKSIIKESHKLKPTRSKAYSYSLNKSNGEHKEHLMIADPKT